MLHCCRYPPSVYPVLAMRGAPASFPVQPEHRELQQHLVFSRRIADEAQKYIDRHFGGEKFVGIHLRNGADWVSFSVSEYRNIAADSFAKTISATCFFCYAFILNELESDMFT